MTKATWPTTGSSAWGEPLRAYIDSIRQSEPKAPPSGAYWLPAGEYTVSAMTMDFDYAVGLVRWFPGGTWDALAVEITQAGGEWATCELVAYTVDRYFGAAELLGTAGYVQTDSTGVHLAVFDTPLEIDSGYYALLAVNRSGGGTQPGTFRAQESSAMSGLLGVPVAMPGGDAPDLGVQHIGLPNPAPQLFPTSGSEPTRISAAPIVSPRYL